MAGGNARSASPAPAGRAGRRTERSRTKPEQEQRRQLRGGDHLTVTVSVALVLAIAVFVLCRYAGLRIWHAAVCVILGFYLASTSFAPYISQFTESLIRSL